MKTKKQGKGKTVEYVAENAIILSVPVCMANLQIL